MRKKAKCIAFAYLVTSSLECVRLPYTVYAVENNGNELAQERMEENINPNIEIDTLDVENRANLENKLWIEEPNDLINNEDIKIRGWALNNSGVKEVKVYIDGVYKGNAQTGIKREDVDKVHPGYLDGINSGYEMLISKNEISTGTHELKIEAVGNDGSIKTEIKTIELFKLENKLWIEDPNAVINNEDIKIRGWALNNSGVKEVKIYIDEEYKGNAQTGIKREDVDQAYPGYPGGLNSGYEMILSKNEISTGTHELKIESVGNDGSIKTEVKTIELFKPENKLWIEEPSTKINHHDIKIRGWALNNSGVKEVKIYIDEEYKGNAQTGIKREDVDQAYPGYPGGLNSGYEMILSKNEISEGNHELRIEAIGNDGSIKSEVRNIEVIKFDNKLWIEEPTATINNENIKVRGWSLNSSGVKEVKIYLDEEYKGNAQIGIKREDVDQAYPGYPGGLNSGYEMILNKNEISPGTHKLKVESIGTDGTIKSNEVEFNLTKPQPRTYIDSPVGDIKLIDGNMYIKGWALNSSGVKEVNVYIDGEFKGKANLGINRPDVDQAYPGYPNGTNSGFSLNVNAFDLDYGNHEIRVEAIGNDGTKHIVTSFINNLMVVEYKDHNYSFDKQVSKQVAKGSDMKFDNAGKYVKATEEEIRYHMDYNNFKNEKDMYQFLRLDIYKNLTSAQDLNNYLQKVLKTPSSNPLSNQGQAFINAAKQYSLDPIYLVAHTLLETGYGSSALAKGYEVVLDDNGNAIYYEQEIDGKIHKFVKIKDSSTPSDAKTVKVYNFFGIGAIDKAAKEGGVTTAYKNGWTTPEKAIYGAADWISSGYINSSKYKQNTLYYMRWYYDTVNGNWHQYATDIGWSRKIASLMYEMSHLYSSKNTDMVYSIPRYTDYKIFKFIENLFN